MKKSYKVLTSAALTAALAIPAVVTPVAAATAASPTGLVFEIDGKQVLVDYQKYLDTLFPSDDQEVLNLKEKITGKVPSALAVNDTYIQYAKFQDLLFENDEAEEKLPVAELVGKAVEDETTHVDEETTAEYEEITGWDGEGNPITEPIEEPEVDEVAPVITVDAEDTIEVENGAEFIVPAATATDDVDGEVEVTSVIKDAEGNELEAIDTTVAGTYTIVYTAVDAAGNTATKEVTVIVKEVEELTVESVSVTDATTLSVTLSDGSTHEVTLAEALEANVETEVTFEIDGKEYTATVTYEVEALEVESVSAINKTVTLNVASLVTEDEEQASVAIFAVEDEEVAETAALEDNYDIEDGKVVVDVKSLETGDYVAVVTVGEEEAEVSVELDFDAVDELVEKVKEAANAAILAQLLDNEEYFENYKVANIDAYFAKVNADLDTIEDIQKIVIDAANTEAEAGSTFEAFKEEVDEATGDYAKYLVLKKYFKYVDDNNMAGYLDDSNGIFDAQGDFDENNTSNDVQEAIDQVNLDAVVDAFDASVKAITDATKPSKLTEAKTALEALELADEELTSVVTGASVNGKTKAEIIEAIDTQLDAIAEAREAADEEIAEAREALDAFKVAFGEAYADEDEYKAVVEKIAELEKDDLSVTELSTDQDGELEGLVAALEAETDALVADAQVASFLETYDDVIKISLVPGNENQVEYTDLPEIDAALEAYDNLNSVAKAKLADGDETDLLVDGITVKAKLDTLELSAKSRYLIDVNLAGTGYMVDRLDFLGNAQYAKLDADQKREVAELFIKDTTNGRPVEGFETNPENAAAVHTAFDQTIVIKLATIVSKYHETLNDINGATTYSEMESAIDYLAGVYGIEGATKTLYAITLLDEKPEAGYASLTEIFATIQ